MMVTLVITMVMLKKKTNCEFSGDRAGKHWGFQVQSRQAGTLLHSGSLSPEFVWISGEKLWRGGGGIFNPFRFVELLSLKYLQQCHLCGHTIINMIISTKTISLYLKVNSSTIVLTGGSPTESWATEYSGIEESEVEIFFLFFFTCLSPFDISFGIEKSEVFKYKNWYYFDYL